MRNKQDITVSPASPVRDGIIMSPVLSRTGCGVFVRPVSVSDLSVLIRFFQKDFAFSFADAYIAESLQDYALLQTVEIKPDDAMPADIGDYNDFPKTETWLRNIRNKILLSAS
jgi:hypothetical protein